MENQQVTLDDKMNMLASTRAKLKDLLEQEKELKQVQNALEAEIANIDCSRAATWQARVHRPRRRCRPTLTWLVSLNQAEAAESARLQEIADLEAKLAQLAGRRARRARRSRPWTTRDGVAARRARTRFGRRPLY